MMATVIRSARSVGVFKDFHVWSDKPVELSCSHPLENLDKTHYLFKLRFLRDAVSKLEYDYYVWIDADSYFVRNPGDILAVMQGAPIHVSLESDACDPQSRRPDWWGCPLSQYSELMRSKGVRSRSIYNMNAGFWIVHRAAVETVYSLCMDFWYYCHNRGITFTEEPPLAYAAHMLSGDPYKHLLRRTHQYWASDWTGNFKDKLPDGDPWWFVDYFTGENIPVNPAIVHAMRSKAALISRTKG
jgi:hypothetical protein